MTSRKGQNMESSVTDFTLFTTKEAERCPGEWIAICKDRECGFHTCTPASGIEEAKRIALDRHHKQRGYRPARAKYICVNPQIVVGRVPDE
jgi:predicted phage tail protein